MSTRKIPIPNFPLPPDQYDPRYFADVVRTYQQAINVLTTPGEGRHTIMVLTDLPNDDVALEEGTLYKLGNDLKVSVLNVASVRGASYTVAGGSVTVSIS